MRTPLQILRSWFGGRPARAATEAAERAQMAVQTFYGSYASSDASLGTFDQFARAGYGAAGDTGNSVVFACIDRRMSVFAEATFKFRNLADKHLHGDPTLAKLEKPWPGGSSSALLARAEQDASLAGNAFIRDTGDGLERLRPDWVTIVSEVQTDALGEQVRRVIGYAYDPVGDPERDLAFYPVGEVAHWAPIPDPLANFRGMSWLTPLIREINADTRMAEFRDAYFTNAATANLAIVYKDKVAPERIERIRTSIAARHTGSQNAFGTLVFDEGADLTVIGANMEGAAFDELQAAGEARICMASGVPALVAGARLGMINSQPGEYEDELRAFADLKMRPNWRSLCAALETVVPPPPGSQLWFDTSDVSALRQGEKDQADTLVQMADAANKFFMAGYTADSITAVLSSGDVSLLVHSGLPSVQTRPGAAGPAAQPSPMPMNGKTPVPSGTGG